MRDLYEGFRETLINNQQDAIAQKAIFNKEVRFLNKEAREYRRQLDCYREEIERNIKAIDRKIKNLREGA